MATPGSQTDPKSSLGSLSCDSGYVDPSLVITVPILHQEPKVGRVSALSMDWISDKKVAQKKSSDSSSSRDLAREQSHIPRPSKRLQKSETTWRRFEKEAGKIGVQPMMKKEELDTTSSKAFKFLAKFHPKYKEERPIAPRKQRSKSAEGRPRKSLSMFHSSYTKVISPNTMRKRDEWANTLRSDSILDEEYYKLPYEEINREILGRFSKSEPRLASLRKAKKKVSFTEDIEYSPEDEKFKADLQSFPSRDSGYFGEKSPDQVKIMDFEHSTETTHIRQLNEVSVPTIITKQNFAELETLLDLVKEQERRLSDDSTQSGDTDTSDDDCFSQDSSSSQELKQSRPVPLPRTKIPSNSEVVPTMDSEPSSTKSDPNFIKHANTQPIITNLDDVLPPTSLKEASPIRDSTPHSLCTSNNNRSPDTSFLTTNLDEDNGHKNDELNPTVEIISEESSETDSVEHSMGSDEEDDRLQEENPYPTDCSEYTSQDNSTNHEQTEDFMYYDEPTSLDVIAEMPYEEYWVASPRSDDPILEGYPLTSQGLEVVMEVPEDSMTPEPICYIPNHSTEPTGLIESCSDLDVSSDKDYPATREPSTEQNMNPLLSTEENQINAKEIGNTSATLGMDNTEDMALHGNKNSSTEHLNSSTHQSNDADQFDTSSPENLRSLNQSSINVSEETELQKVEIEIEEPTDDDPDNNEHKKESSPLEEEGKEVNKSIEVNSETGETEIDIKRVDEDAHNDLREKYKTILTEDSSSLSCQSSVNQIPEEPSTKDKCNPLSKNQTQTLKEYENNSRNTSLMTREDAKNSPNTNTQTNNCHKPSPFSRERQIFFNMIPADQVDEEAASHQKKLPKQNIPSITVECKPDSETDKHKTISESCHSLNDPHNLNYSKNLLEPELELKRPLSPTPQSPLNRELISELPQRTSTPENSLDAPSFQYPSNDNTSQSTSEGVQSIFLPEKISDATKLVDYEVEKQLLYGTERLEENFDETNEYQRKEEDIELESDSGKSSNSEGVEYDSAAETGSDSDELLHIDISRDTNFDSSFNSEDSLLSKPHKDVELSRSLSQIVEYDSATESGSEKEESRKSVGGSTTDQDFFKDKGKSPTKTEYDSAFSTASTPFSEPDVDLSQTQITRNISPKTSCSISHETNTSTKLTVCHDVIIPEVKNTKTHLSNSPKRKHNSTLLSSFTKPKEPETQGSLNPSNLGPKELEEFNRQKIKEALAKAGINPTVLDLLDKEKQDVKTDFDTSMANIFMTKDLSFRDHQLVLNTRTNSVKPRVTVSRVRVPLSQIRNGWIFSSDPPLIDQMVPEQIQNEEVSDSPPKISSDSPTPSSTSHGSSSGCYSSACSPQPASGTVVREIPFPTAL